LGNTNQLPESSRSSDEIFGDALRTLRRAAGMTQAELAERANLSLRGLSDLERGINRYPRRETLVALADAFGLVEDERARLFASARRRPAHSSPGASLPPTEQEMEPALRHISTEPAAQKGVEVDGSDQVADLPQVVGNFLSAQPVLRLVAREMEMEQLLTALDCVQAGTGRLIFLRGEPGVGKTRLAQEVSMVARERGFFIITGRCYAPQETVPYYPFLEALSRAYASGPAAVRSAMPERWSQVARLLPESRIEVPPAQEGPAGGSAEDQQRLFWQVSGFLQALAAERPLALLLDDLQWMDGASLALLMHLARHTRESPILLLGTYRDIGVAPSHPLAKGVHDLSREHLMECIEVQQLAREGTAALLSATLHDGQVSEAVTALIHGPTEGNAFFAQEVLRALVERGDVTLVDGQWELCAGVDVVVPENVRMIILERVARLSPAAQQALAVASVLGQTFRFNDLLAGETRVRRTSQPHPVADVSETSVEVALEEGLEEAVHALLVREDGGVRYSFSHALTQRAVYEQLSARRLHRLHLAVAEMIEDLPGRDRTLRVTEVAYHFLKAEEAARALPYLLLAGDQAQTVYANAEAEKHFRTAARLAAELGDLETEADALERLGLLHWWNLGNYEQAADMLEQAIKAQRAATGGRIRSQTAGMLARAYGRSGHPDRALVVLAPWLEEESRQLRVDSERPEIQASLAIAFADVCFHTGAYLAQLAAAERAARLWGELGDARARADALLLRGIALRVLGHWQEGLVVLEETVKEAREAGALYVCAHASYHMGYSYLQSGEWEQAAASIEVALDLNRQAGNQMFSGSSLFLQGLLEYHKGDWAAARHWFEQAQRHYAHSSREVTRAYAPIGPGLIGAATGDLEEGVRYLQEAISICQDEGVPFILHRVQREMAEVELLLGRTAEARMRLQPLVETPGFEAYNDVTPLLPLLAWACIELGDDSQAEALLERAAPQAEAQRHYLALLDVLRVRGLLCIQQQRWQEGQEVLNQALTLARGMPHPYAEAKVLYASGCLEAARGDPARARQLFTAGLAICTRLGERLYAERIEREMSALDS
jgi:predicted ATPase/transcriptional regulator with XRE-family HTH domain